MPAILPRAHGGSGRTSRHHRSPRRAGWLLSESRTPCEFQPPHHRSIKPLQDCQPGLSASERRATSQCALTALCATVGRMNVGRSPNYHRLVSESPRLSLSVVIPGHNESESIQETVDGLATAAESAGIDYDVIVVDD